MDGGWVSGSRYVFDAVSCAMDRHRTGETERGADDILVFEHRGRSSPADIRDSPRGSCFYRGAVRRTICVFS